MFKKHNLALSLTAVAAALYCNQAAAQQSSSTEPQQLMRVEVTGSNIKRLSAETASVVQVISRNEVKQTGANTVRQVLDTITATTGTELRDDGASTSFASGATGVSMRGLGKGATLVLLNGRRIANYGLADGAQFTFVNIDSIPADIIDRVEILKDGASAVYGSDAMAGVINIITRSEYQGVGMSGSYQSGLSPNIGQQATLALVAGKGDMARDRYNVLANVEYYQRDGYMLTDVMGHYPAWHKQFVNPAFGDPSLVSWPGNIINGSARVANPACPASQKNSAGACTTNINGLTQMSDPAERVNAFFAGRLQISDSIEAFGDVSYSKTQTDYLAIPYGINAPASPFRWFDGNAKTVRLVNKPMLPVTHPLNTFGKPVGIEYRFMDPGIDWVAPAYGTQYRMLAGLKGTFTGWDWETTIGRVGADATKESLAPHSANFIGAIQSGEYKIGGTNSPELLARMFHSAAIHGTNHQNHVDAKVSGELFALPAGKVQAAFGGEIRQDDVNIQSVDEVMRAELIGRGALWVEGRRTMNAAFAEMEAPLAKGLSANGALRYDKTSGYSGHVSPKMGLRWEVSPQLLLRGTAAGGFRAPNVPEVLGKIGVTGFFNGTYDPKRCDTAIAIRDILKNGDANDKAEATNAYNTGCSASVPAMISSNPKLEPELSKSLTLGFVFQPVRDMSVAVDYFKIERRNEISYRSPDYVLQREGQPFYQDMIARLPVGGQDLIWAARANQLKPGANIAWNAGQLVTLLLAYENFGKTETSGVDVSMRGRIAAGDAGVLNLGLDLTYALTMREWDIDAGKFRPNRVGLRNVPRTKAVLSGSWQRGPWTVGARMNFTSGTALNTSEADLASWSPSACATRLKPGDIACYLSEDMQTTLSLAYSGFKNLRLSAILANIEGDRPVDLRGGYAVRPTTLKVGAEYKF
jgi:iron complex outermembrane receptor protein